MTWRGIPPPRDSRYRESPNSALSMSGWRAQGEALSGLGDTTGNILSWLGRAVRGNAELGVGAPVGMPLGGGTQRLMGGQYQDILTGNRRMGPGGIGAGTPTSTTSSFLDRLPNTAQEWADMGTERMRERGGVLPKFDAVTEGKDVVQDFWQEQYDRYLAGIAAEEQAVRAGYSPVLEGLEDEIGDLRAAAASVGVPFDKYLAARQEIGAGVGDAAALEGTIKPVINKVYDDATAEMKVVYDQLNLNLGEEITNNMVGRVRELEATMEDVIRTDESSVDLLHQKSSEYAKAMAQAAYSNDIYAAVDAETKIQAQLDFKIEETAEEISRQRRAMQAAIDAATARFDASFEYGEPEFNKVVDEAWNEYFSSNNVPEHERSQAKAIFEQLVADPQNLLNESSWRKGVNGYLSQAIFNSLGVSNEDIEARMGAAAEAGSKSPNAIMSLMGSQDLASLFKKGQTQTITNALVSSGWSEAEARSIVARGSANADSFLGAASPEAKHLRNMYTTRTKISQSWDQIASSFGPTVDESQVARAPNGFTFPIVGGGSYSNSYGYKRSSAQVKAGKMPVHQGIDIMAAKGSHMVSPVSGTVVAMDYGNTGGNFIKIRDDQGNVHYMAHMNSLSKNLQSGSRVKAGTFVGTVGNTGNARDTSPHVHYEIRAKNGNRLNPYGWLQSTGIGKKK
jgi:murein DD-endopeptidase MepM/ murein hydrolase activator NlpD